MYGNYFTGIVLIATVEQWNSGTVEQWNSLDFKSTTVSWHKKRAHRDYQEITNKLQWNYIRMSCLFKSLVMLF